MIWLILSILCSTIIFILFKLFGKYRVSNLQAIIANYAVAGTLGWLPFYDSYQPALNVTSWSYWPLVIGILFITLFQMMARITQVSGVNVVSVTVKMSVVIPVLFGILWHLERLHLLNILGVILALFAVYFINKPKEGRKLERSLWLGPLILFIGSGILDTMMKMVEAEIVIDDSLAQFTGTSFAVAGVLGVLYLLLRIYIFEVEKWSPKSWLWGVLLGIPNYGSIYFLLRALNGKWASAIVFPINNVGVVAVSALMAWILFNERITKWRTLGLILAISAIYLLSYSE